LSDRRRLRLAALVQQADLLRPLVRLQQEELIGSAASG
jgi:hypothetical protein